MISIILRVDTHLCKLYDIPVARFLFLEDVSIRALVYVIGGFGPQSFCELIQRLVLLHDYNIPLVSDIVRR